MNIPSAFVTLLLLGLAGCVSATPSPSAPVVASPTHANQTLDQEAQRDGRFIGLAISGGGRRAAVFGGALPAAYYALDGYRTIEFANGFLERMGHDFQSEMRGRFLSPGNLLAYWFTDATKSDTVVHVLDDQLFHGATYADLNPARPKLLLNATDALTGEPFVISDESFAGLALPLPSFSVARAVYMSAAYPGVFNPVPLYGNTSSSDSATRPAVLAYDGGPVDNLGVKTLVNLLRNADQGAPIAARFPGGCLIISVDATPRIAGEQDQPLSASTVLLKSQRREVLEGVGIVAAQQDHRMFSTFPVNGSQSACTFWHLALRQLPDTDPLGARVTRIKTSFGLESTDQDALIRAAHHLIEQGIQTLHDEGAGPAFLRDIGNQTATNR
ncbi:MAG: hypothetical protein Q8N04_18265 [Nitrospira sp.]|nr:hypothetical protein [Nitrospira sp.]